MNVKLLNDPIIRCDHLGKKFSKSLKHGMLYGLIDIAKTALIPRKYRSQNWNARLNDAKRVALNSIAELNATQPPQLRANEFWALWNISFSLYQGECLGIVGHNGAGKSTLFCVLSGIYGPDAGRAIIKGRVHALIALGAGFHPLMSGLENIYLNAAIYGMRGKEIDKIINKIIEFAELGEFIHAPVKYYSSGMLVRLGFASAINLEPDVLLIDEVLAVGDHSFKLKCNKKISELREKGVPILFVSHASQAIETISNRVMWLDHGQIRMIGDPKTVLNAYVEYMDKKYKTSVVSNTSNSPIEITTVSVRGRRSAEEGVVFWRDDLFVRLTVIAKERIINPYIIVRIMKLGCNGGLVTYAFMSHDGFEWEASTGVSVVECVFPSIQLTHGVYEIWCAILRHPTTTTGLTPYQDDFYATSFRVVASKEEMGLPGVISSIRGDLPGVVLPHYWRVLK